MKPKSTPGAGVTPLGPSVFEKELLTAADFCSRYGYALSTIYEWRYRPQRNKVPENLVVKIRGKLFIRHDIFRGLIPE